MKMDIRIRMFRGSREGGAGAVMRMRRCLPAFAAVFLAAGCQAPAPRARALKRVAPTTQPAQAARLALGEADIEPIWREALPVDLPTVARVAGADNLDIQQARQRIAAAQGNYESRIGSLFPVLAPTALFEHVEGTVRATPGALVGVGFNTFSASITLQLILSPGQVIYDIVAAGKRLEATHEALWGLRQDVLRRAANQYYELLLSQARVHAARDSLAQTRELLRIARLRVEKGVGVPADELQAEARMAQRQQELVIEINRFHSASVDLASTLHLDPTVTLVPNQREIVQTVLVDAAIDVGELLSLAMDHRSELQEFRQLADAAGADTKSNWWKWLGPQFSLGYQIGGITGHSSRSDQGSGVPGNLVINPFSPTGSFSSNPGANGLIKEAILNASKRGAGRSDETFGFKSQQKASAGVGWRLSVSALGEQKTNQALERQASLAFHQTVDQIKAQVVRARQTGLAAEKLIGAARRQVSAAQEAVRLTEANLAAGMAVTLDVLVAEDSLAQARRQYADAVVRFNQAQVDLIAALGLISLEAIGQAGNNIESNSA